MRAYAIINSEIFEVEGSIQDDGTFRCLYGPPQYNLRGWELQKSDWYVTKECAYHRLETLFNRMAKSYTETAEIYGAKNPEDLEYYTDLAKKMETSAREARDMDPKFMKKMENK